MIQKLKNMANSVSEKFKNSSYRTKRVIALCILALIVALIVVIALLPLMKSGRDIIDFFRVELVSADRQPETHEFSDSYEPPVLIRPGYDFEGWFMDEDYSIDYNIGSLNKNNTNIIYAKWEPKTFVITFETNGGSEVEDISQAYNSQLTLPIPTREAYTFDGWYMEEGLQTPFTNVTMPLDGAQLYAKWRYTPFENTLTISASNIVYGNSLIITIVKNTSGGAVSYQYKVQGADDSTYSATAPIQAGNYTVKVTAQATANYKSAVATANFAINKATYDMSGAGWNYTSAFVYDGTEKEVAVVGLPNGVTVISYTNNKKTQVGSYTAIAVLSYDAANYNEPIVADLQYWSIEKMESELSILANNIVYGNSLDITVSNNTSGGAVSYQYKGQEEPDFLYSAVPPTQAGNYIVKATSQETSDYKSAVATSAFAINKATYDMSGAGWDYTSAFEYDGTDKIVEVVGLPNGVTVISYINNQKTNAGSYTARANLYYDAVNYNAPIIADLEWWVIEKAENSFAISANDIVYGNYPDITIVTNTSGGEVSYLFKVQGEGDSAYSAAVPTEVGNYTVKATAEATINYESAFDTADFAISKATYDMSDVSFEDTSIEYDGLEKTVAVSGVLPAGLNVTYLNNTGNIEPDEYTVTAVFEGDSTNYYSVPDMTAILTIYTSLHIERLQMDDVSAISGNNISISPMGISPELLYVSKGTSTSSNIMIPNTYYGEAVSVIAENGFENYPMTSIVIGNNIRWIEGDAFKGCNNLQSIFIPENVDYINGNVFMNCGALMEIIVDENNDDFLSIDGVLFDSDNLIVAYPIGKANTSYTVPLGTEDIGSYSFYNAKNLTELIFTVNIKSIIDYAFFGCSNLTALSINEGLTSIYNGAFENCTSLENITLPESLLSIFEDAFADCSSLKTVYVLRSSSLDRTNSFGAMFKNCHEDLIIYVSDYESEVAYNADLNWNPAGVTYIIVAIKYTVTFDNQAGAGGDDSIDISIGQEMPSVATPKKEGYIFSGYYTQSEGRGTQYYNEDMESFVSWHIAQATTLYAYWLPGTQGLLFTLINGDAEYSVSRGTATDANVLLPEVHKGKPVTAMPNDAFRDYSNMQSIIIPASINTVGTNVLTGCIALTTLTAPFKAPFNAADNSYLRYYFGGTSWNTGTVPETLTTVHITKGTTVIGEDAFRDLSQLTTVTIPNTITSLGDSVFMDCTGLINVNFEQGSNLTTIGDDTFSGCKLTSIIIPKSVTTIGQSAFQSCSDLISVVFEANSNLTSIGYAAFAYSDRLTNIIIPSSVTTIMPNAFLDCAYLESVTFGANSQLGTIGNEAFRGCTSLANIIIPSTVSTIGDNVFQECTDLTTVRMLSETVPTAGTTIFNGCTGLTAIYVPIVSGSAYKTAANWSVYEPIIFGITLMYFDTDRGEAIQPMYVHGSVTLPTPTRYGAEFLGWYTSVEFETPYDFSTITTSTYTVYAKWFVQDQGLRFDLINGGTEYAVSKGRATDVHIVIPSVYNGLPVTTLPSWAFNNYSTMLSIEIPASITTVENFTFNGCTSMVKFTAPFMEIYGSGPSGLGYYFGSIPASLKTVIMADNGITSIAPSLFYGASGVTTIKLLDSITSIGAWAFYRCSSLTSITLPETMTTIEERTFSSCSSLTSITLPNSITSIGPSAFSFCSSLSNITIPASVTTISDNAFLQCTSFTEFNLPITVTSIGERILANCTSLETLTVPFKGVYEEDTNSYLGFFFGNSAPSSLKTVNVADNGITSLGHSAFFGALHLTKITLPDSITSIGNSAFKGCSSLQEFIIPSGITEIGESVFQGCTALTELILPEGVTTIGYYAFYECGIQELTLPQGLTTIEFMGFRGSHLTELSIPASVTFIGEMTFAYCPNLTKLIMEGSTPPAAGSDLRIGTDKLALIYVPIGSVNAYKTATSWTNHAGIIDSSSVLTFECNGGSTISEMVVTSKTLLPIPTKAGMALYGWYMESDFINPYSFWNITTETVTVYAKWSTATDGLLYTPINNNKQYAVSRGTATDTHVVIPEMYYGKPVTTMPENAFRDYTTLESITMPKTMAIVGKNVLTGCTSINTLSTPYNIFLTYYFGGVEWRYSPSDVPASLKTINITEGKTTIADNAFRECTNLTTVTISSGYTTIGNSAFRGCTGLKNVTIAETAGVYIYAGNETFRDCTSLESISIPGTAGVGPNLLTGCTSLKTLVAPLTRQVGSNFYLKYYFGGTSWDDTKASVPSSLKTFTLSSPSISLDHHAFANCADLTTVILPETLTMISVSAFESSGITNITIPASVTQIGSSAFKNLGLTNVTIPSGVTIIDQYAFSNCAYLESVTFGENSQLETLGHGAFSSCTSLTSIIIPSNVSAVGNYVFQDCTALTTIRMLSDTVPTGGITMFGGCTNLTAVYVLMGLVNAYKTTLYWQVYESIIVGSTLIVFDTDGGEELQPIYVHSSTALPTPTKEGGEFLGWYTSSAYETLYDFSTITTSTYTVYAKWLMATQGLLFTLITGDTEYSVSRGTATDTDIVIPAVHNGKPVTAMPNDAFKDYSTMQSIIIPPSINAVGTNALTGCTALTTMTAPFKGPFNASNHSYLRYYFGGTSWNTGAVPETLTTVHIAKGTTGIGADAFRNLSQLTTVTIPNTITSIGTSLFYGCTNLVNVSFEANSQLETINYSMFYLCGIKNITIPKSVKTFSGSAFTYSQLEEISFEEGTNLTTIGNDTFSQSKLISIIIPKRVTTIGLSAFQSCSKLESVVFEEDSNLTSIGNSAFGYCSKIKNIIIPSSVTTLINHAFWHCSYLESVTFEENSQLETIEKETFRGCLSLTSIILPSNVSTMGDNVFQGCTALTTLTMLGATPPTAGTTIFNGCTALTTIYVPIGSLSAYQTAINWTEYAGIMTEYTFMSFETNGGEEILSMLVAAATSLPTPTKAGYIFDGWYSDTGLTLAYDFATITTSTYTVYAKWQAE